MTLFYPALVGTLHDDRGAALVLASRSRCPGRTSRSSRLPGLLGTIGHFLFILAFQRAPASALTPFTYMQLVWATLVGWLAFGNFPDAWTLAGMAVIAGSGLLIALHERRRAQAAAAGADGGRLTRAWPSARGAAVAVESVKWPDQFRSSRPHRAGGYA